VAKKVSQARAGSIFGADTIRGYLRGAKDWLAARLQ
jgi:hypothetical protein